MTGNYFDLLGVKAVLGHTFTAEEDNAPNAHPVAVLAHACWRTRYNSDPQIVGQTVLLNGRAFTVIGVLPDSFKGMELVYQPELYVPCQMKEWVEPGNAGSLTNRGYGQWFGIERLRRALLLRRRRWR